MKLWCYRDWHLKEKDESTAGAIKKQINQYYHFITNKATKITVANTVRH